MKRFIPIVLTFLGIAIFSGAIVCQDAARPNATLTNIRPLADHHQHVFSPAYVDRSTNLKPIAASDVIQMMDAAGIQRGVLLSTGFSYGRPGREPADEYEKVKAENDYTAAQARLYPKRLIAFCSFNPLKGYALEELARCAKDPDLRHGLKFHIGNSDVQLEIPEQFEQMKKIFQAANQARMAIAVHMRASLSKNRPYGPEQARAFLDLLSFAPDITVQVAHMASAGPGFAEPQAHAVLEVLADAVANKDRRARNLWFDFASNPHPSNPPEVSELLTKMMRKIGVKRILYGTDGAAGGNLLPKDSWQAFLQLKLSEKEIKTIAGNRAPYLR